MARLKGLIVHRKKCCEHMFYLVSTLISNSQTNICVYKVKSHAGTECADAVAKYQANQANDSVADTGIPGAGPGVIHSLIYFG
eukprot:1144115-Pelagomonas_calceolata.AAC.1